MNEQNAHIVNRLKDATQAVRELVNAGLTVTHVEVEGPQPRINLLTAPKHEDRLPISTKTFRKGSRGYEIEMAAYVNGCEVRWLENV